jgi:hypothetical protein
MQLPRLAQISPEERQAFWRYCVQTKNAARERSRTKSVPCNIDDHLIDRLLVDQNWRCAVSGIPLKAPRGYREGYRKDPFGPSLDRIVPALGYVDGNLRIVCNIVNSAMNEWGLESLLELLNAMAPKPRRGKPGPKLLVKAKPKPTSLRSMKMARRATAQVSPDSARSAHP